MASILLRDVAPPYPSLASSSVFSVSGTGAPTSAPSSSTFAKATKNSYANGEDIVVSFLSPVLTNNSWIGIYNMGQNASALSSPVMWKYVVRSQYCMISDFVFFSFISDGSPHISYIITVRSNHMRQRSL